MSSTQKRKEKKRDWACFVPGCRSGYPSFKETHSLFTAPLDPKRLEAWSRNIRRKDRTLDHTCVVCDRHFDERFIERTFRTTIKGEVVEIPRDRVRLSNDAIPTIFPEAPKYFTKSLPKKRKERNLCDQVLPKPKQRRKKNAAETPDANTCGQVNGCADSTASSSEAPSSSPGRNGQVGHVETNDERLSFSKLQTPPGWSEITLIDNEDLFLYAQCEADAAEPYGSVVMVKSVRIQAAANADTVVAEVHLRGNIWCQEEITTRSDAERLIDDVNKLALCPGVGLYPLAGDCPAYNGKFFSRDCTLFAHSKPLRPCDRCRYQRKLIQNQMSWKKNQMLKKRKGYEIVMTRTSDMRWRVEVSTTDAKRGQMVEEVAVDSMEVFQEPGTEKPNEPCVGHDQVVEEVVVSSVEMFQESGTEQPKEPCAGHDQVVRQVVAMDSVEVLQESSIEQPKEPCAKHDQVVKEVAVDSVEVLQKSGKEQLKEPCARRDQVDKEAAVEPAEAFQKSGREQMKELRAGCDQMVKRVPVEAFQESGTKQPKEACAGCDQMVKEPT